VLTVNIDSSGSRCLLPFWSANTIHPARQSGCNVHALRLELSHIKTSAPVGFNGSASVEFEGTTTTSEGDIGPASDFGPGATGQWDIDTMAIYFAYRTPGIVYFKGKLGGIASDVNANFTGGTLQQDDASFAYGAGLGVRLGQVGKIEVEYTGASGDNDIGLISVGGILEF
jgi:hypothetical protein